MDRGADRPGRATRALVVCGVVTNLCVETTIRSAFMRDFPVRMLADCCAAQTRRLHELSLEVLSSYRLARIESITAGFDLAEAHAQASAEARAQASAEARAQASAEASAEAPAIPVTA